MREISGKAAFWGPPRPSPFDSDQESRFRARWALSKGLSQRERRKGIAPPFGGASTNLAGPEGLEPPASRLEAASSIHLSYGPEDPACDKILRRLRPAGRSIPRLCPRRRRRWREFFQAAHNPPQSEVPPGRVQRTVGLNYSGARISSLFS